MPNIRPSTLLLQIAIMELLQDAEAFGISKPLIMSGLKQIGQGMAGTAVSQIPDTGLKQSLWTQFLKDTRDWHLYVFSGLYHSKTEFILRLLQYVAIEYIGLSCGHLRNGSVAVLTGAVRNAIITANQDKIAYTAAPIKKALEIDAHLMALAAACSSQGKTKCLKLTKAILTRIRGGETGAPCIYLLSPSSSVDFPRININYLEAQMRFKQIYENMIQQQTLRRYLNGNAQKAFEAMRNPFFYSPVTRIIPLNIAGVVGYGLLALTGLGVLIFGSLILFQRAENRRYKLSRHSGIVIDVNYSIEDEDIE